MYNFETFNKDEAQKRLDFQNEIIVDTLKENGFTDVEVEERKHWGKVAKFTINKDSKENNCVVFANGFRYKKKRGYSLPFLDVYVENSKYNTKPYKVDIPISEENYNRYKKYVEEHPDSYLHRV